MPVHRVPRAHIVDEYRRLHREGERVEHVVVDGDDYVFFTATPTETSYAWFNTPAEIR